MLEDVILWGAHIHYDRVPDPTCEPSEMAALKFQRGGVRFAFAREEDLAGGVEDDEHVRGRGASRQEPEVGSLQPDQATLGRQHRVERVAIEDDHPPQPAVTEGSQVPTPDAQGPDGDLDHAERSLPTR